MKLMHVFPKYQGYVRDRCSAKTMFFAQKVLLNYPWCLLHLRKDLTYHEVTT